MAMLWQISDLHFGTERPEVVSALENLVRSMPPELVVLSGDITQRARRAEFQAARSFVDRLSAPATLIIPGNHDIPLFNLIDRAIAPYANHCRSFGPELEPVYDSPTMLVIGVNTTRRWRHVDGEVSANQRERVAQRLSRASAEQLRIVVTHQPVAVTRAEDITNLLHGHKAAIYDWSNAGADLILGGHIHLPFVLPLHKYYDDLRRQVWVAQAGTAVSTRIRRGANNSVNLVRSTGMLKGSRTAMVQRWDYSDTARRFTLKHTDSMQFGSRQLHNDME
ncbi:metallophosphoesterase family protein [Nitrosomonas supralitoralis]|uniref:DNA repair exonuclease n=1 Tax=Nitrosomonas supralitoralis TaxID=2116706 RepID=A0A2P7NS41_9PROT|nr:metallophosphoesterase [Nitrosomonas supralitoralis]PSJ16259.1 DNA repair exonuclease [Nitrosomonas supralitoralis]